MTDSHATLAELARLRRGMRFWFWTTVAAILIAAGSFAASWLTRGRFQALRATSIWADAITTTRIDLIDENGQPQGMLGMEGDQLIQLKLGTGIQLSVVGNGSILEMQGPNGHVVLALSPARAVLTLEHGDPLGLHSRVSLVTEANQSSLHQETADGSTVTGSAEIGANAQQSYVRVWSLEGTGWEIP
jgi:hypothetical protein